MSLPLHCSLRRILLDSTSKITNFTETKSEIKCTAPADRIFNDSHTEAGGKIPIGNLNYISFIEQCSHKKNKSFIHSLNSTKNSDSSVDWDNKYIYIYFSFAFLNNIDFLHQLCLLGSLLFLLCFKQLLL